MWNVRLTADGVASETVPARDREELCALLVLGLSVVAALVDDQRVEVLIAPARKGPQ